MSTFKVVISHFSFLISHTKQRLLINLLKEANVYYQYCKSFICGKNFGSVLNKIRLSNRLASMKI